MLRFNKVLLCILLFFCLINLQNLAIRDNDSAILEESFVTFATKDYFPLLEVLIASIHEFSSRPVVAYGINDDIPFSEIIYPRLIKRRIDDAVFCKKPRVFFQKFNIILKSNIKYGIYVESDDIVNYGIDNLFEKSHLVNQFPLCPKHVHDPNNQAHVMKLMNVSVKTNPYVHGHIIFSEKSLPFIKECLDFCTKYNDQIKANWDETVLNVMLWKHQISDFYLPVIDPPYQSVNNYLQASTDQLINKSYYMFHGCKNVNEAWTILQSLKTKWQL